MKIYKNLFLVFFIIPLLAISQEKATDTIVKEKPERPAFESSFLIDNPTNVLFSKNTLEIQMGHRFGEIVGENNDLAGFWDYSNIRIGVTYGLHDRLTVGFGTTKDQRLQDFNWKVALLRQTRSNKVPFSISYYGNFVIDARTKDNFYLKQQRYSFFNQLIIAKRFNPKLSLQIAPSISHFNMVEEGMKNDVFSIALGGRYKVSDQTSIIADYSLPMSDFDVLDPKAGLSFGVEFGTSAHTFQLFATNYFGIVPQQNYLKNQKVIAMDQYLIGFNITRNYNF